MSSERVATNVLRWQTDQASLNTTLQGAKAVADAQLEAADANRILAKSADVATIEVQKQTRAQSKSFKSASKEAVDYGDRIKTVRDETEALGDADSALVAVAGLAASGIAGEAGRAAGSVLVLGADLLATAEALPKLGTSLVEIGAKANALPGILGASSTAFAGIATGAPPAAAGLASIVGAIAPIAVTAAAIIAPVAALIKVFNDAKQATQDFLDQQEASAEAQKNAVTRAATLTEDQLLKEIELAEKRLGLSEGYVSALEGQRKRVDELTADLGAAFDPLRRNVLAITAGQLDEKLTTANEERAKEEEALRILKDQILPVVQAREAEAAVIQSGLMAARDLAAAEQRRTELLRSGTLQSINDEIIKRRESVSAIDAELAELEKLDQTNEDVIARIDELNAARDDESVALTMLVNDIQPVIAAREAESAALKQQISDIQSAADNELERGRIIKDLTTEQRIAGQEQAQAQIEALREQRAALMELDQTSEEVQSALAEVNAKLKEAEGDFKFYAGTAARSAAMTNELQAAEEERAQKTLATNEKLASDIDRIETQAADKRRDMQRKLADDLVDLATDIARDTEDAFRSLQQDRQDLARDLNRDLASSEQDAAFERLDAQVEIQREEARAFREHANKLQDLRRQQQFEELDLIANRDFAALFRSRRQAAFQEQTLGIEATRTQGERQLAADQELQDIARNAERERQARLVQYEQQLQDTQLAFDRERETIEINRQRALEDLRLNYRREERLLIEKTQRELQIRSTAAQQELQLINQAAQQRIQLQQQANQNILQQFASFFPALQGLANRAQQIFNQNQINTNITMQSQVNPVGVGRAVGEIVSRILG